MTAKANALKAQGVDVISFAAGEPDFNTPEPISDATIEAIRSGFTKYTPSSGIPALKEAIVDKLLRENHIKSEPAQIVASCGAKHALYNIFQVLLDPGDEVILIAPYWMTYADQIQLAGGKPVVVHAFQENDFQPDPENIKAAITPRTRAIVVNSPCNPTGAMLPRSSLKEIAALALRNDLWIISDEIYDRLVYGGEHQSFAALSSEVAEHTITVGGCSKTYAMTGWRLGFACAPVPIAKAIANLQDQMTSNPTSFVQKGAIVAFRLPHSDVEAMRSEFEARRDLVVKGLLNIPNVNLSVPMGAFYVLPDISAYFGKSIANDVEMADYLLDSAKVATVPGSVFEGPGRIRISYATSRSNISAGVERIREALIALD